jgi:hypothetical protein
MEIEDQLKLTRDEQLALEPTVVIDTTDAPLLGGYPPINNPRAYGMTDFEALEWNRNKQSSVTS